MAGFRINIDDGRNAPVKPLEPPGGGAVPRVAGAQSSSEFSTNLTIGTVVASGTQDGLTAVYNPTSQEVDFTNTDKGSVAVAAHEGAADPHPQYTTDAEATAIAEAVVAAAPGGGGILPVVTGDVPPVLVYLEDGSLVYTEVA